MTGEQKRTIAGMGATVVGRGDRFRALTIRDPAGRHWLVRLDGRVHNFDNGGWMKPPIGMDAAR